MSGQLTTRWIARKLNEFLNKAGKTQDQDYVAALDTDSVYLILDKVIEDNTVGKTTAEKIDFMNKFCNSVIQPFIDKSYKELSEYTNAYEHHLKMKLEVLADVGIFYRKKRYLLNVHASEGVLYAEPKLKIKGLSMIQSSTPEVVRDSLRNSIHVALKGSEKEIQTYTDDFRTKFNAFAPEQIAFTRSANGLKEYSDKSKIYAKGTPIAVRGALLYNYHLKRLGLDKKYQLITNGDKIKFIYLMLPNPFHENIIAFPQYLPVEFGLHEYIDYDVQFDKSFKDSLNDLIEPMGWKLDHGSTIEDFFV
jgi:DNA polymerase elongation subunit (family B)